MITFTNEDEELIIRRIAELRDNGSTLKSAYETLSEEMKKPADAIKRRHVRLRGENDDIDYRRPFSTEEDAIVYSRISAAKAAGIDLTVAYTSVADELGRPVGSIQNRFGRIRTKMAKMNSSSIDSTVEQRGSMVMLKLKGLVSEVSKFREREVEYKNEIRDLKREIGSTRKELSLIKGEYEKMVSELHLVFNS